MLVSWFEIPVVDIDRAVAFYERVLSLEFERTVIDGHPMALFPQPDEPGRSSGALATGDSYEPSIDGTRVYFAVDDVAATLDRAIAAGGRELYPVTAITEDMAVAEFADSEGNRVALSGPAGR